MASKRKAAPKVDAEAVSATLKALVMKRLRNKRQRPTQPVARPSAAQVAANVPFGKQRRSARRLGKYQRYEVIRRLNTSKRGTWTRYMVDIILAHTEVQAANETHAASGEYAGKRLDFNWAVAQGYIKLI